MFFTPKVELLDVRSDEDVDLSVTLPSTSTSEHRAHTPFTQYAILGDSPDVTGGGGRSGQVGGSFMSPARVKRKKIPKIRHGGESGGTRGSANAGLFETPGGIGVGGV